MEKTSTRWSANPTTPQAATTQQIPTRKDLSDEALLRDLPWLGPLLWDGLVYFASDPHALAEMVEAANKINERAERSRRVAAARKTRRS